MVFPDPSLVESEAVDMLEELKILFQIESRIPPDGMHRGGKNAEAKRTSSGH
jgi:hypothetical protein